MNTPSHRAALLAAYQQGRLTDAAASMAVDLAPGSYDLPFWHPHLPEVEAAEVFRHADRPDEVSTYTFHKPHGVVITATARALSAFAVLACLALPAHAEPCKVNVSTCGPAECALLPGVGMVTAGRISAAHPKTEAELDAVKGIGPKKLDALKPFVTFEGPTTCTDKQHAVKGGAK